MPQNILFDFCRVEMYEFPTKPEKSKYSREENARRARLNQKKYKVVGERK